MSDLISKMFYWDCELCGKSVILSNEEQRGQTCLCIECARNELKFESMFNEVLSQHNFRGVSKE